MTRLSLRVDVTTDFKASSSFHSLWSDFVARSKRPNNVLRALPLSVITEWAKLLHISIASRGMVQKEMYDCSKAGTICITPMHVIVSL